MIDFGIFTSTTTSLNVKVGQDLCPDSGFGRASGGFGMKNRMPWVAAGLEMVISGCSTSQELE
jgi:hypothetical protein